MMGRLFRIVETNELIPGIELIVRRGLSNLMTLMAEMFCCASWIETHPRITTKKSSYTKLIVSKSTYDVPSVPQVAMGPHDKAHGNNFQDHLSCVNHEKNEINCVAIFRNTCNLPVDGQEKAIHKNDDKNKPIEPWIDGDKLNDLVTEWVRHRQAAK
jgi:hypothetical protein